jgi:FtsP/CotA-like multicopper oxidase with cupredoxin domain
MSRHVLLGSLAACACAAAALPSRLGAQPPFPQPVLSLAALPRGHVARVDANDNRRPAGRLAGGVLTVALEARVGVWRPEGGAGPALAVAAFAESGKALTTPGPLLRVPLGTEVRATVRNALPMPIAVHGLGDVRGAAGPGTTVPPGEVRAFRFRADAPGLSYYVARASAAPPLARAHDDAQLHGAIVVDAPGDARPDDRIFVISNWFTRDTTTVSGLGPGATLAINGRGWPHTERIAMAQGDTARWRVVNASTLTHPMHLHGAYFRVDARGDGVRDTLYGPDARRLAVTEVLAPGQTMALAWTPVHPGNWLFHCHLASHITPREQFEADRRMPPGALAHAAHTAARAEARAAARPVARHAAHGAGEHMAGLVLGVTVAPRGAMPTATGPERALRLVARSRAAVYGEYPGYAFVLGGSAAEAVPDSLPLPGPVLELVRGQPVAATLVNRTHDPIAVHWHGLEIASYPDGVPGWSGAGRHLLPAVAPGDSLTVRFTPPRAGTFMYHSHANEMQQISSGLYGAIVVTEPGASRDVAADHVVVVSDGGPLVDFFGASPPAFVNGGTRPAPLVLAAGRPNRLRLVNVRAEALTALTLRDGDATATWRVVAKDGAPLPPARVRELPATLRFAPGETYDVEITPRAGAPLTLRWESAPASPRGAGALELRAR